MRLKMWTPESTVDKKVQKLQRESKTTQIFKQSIFPNSSQIIA